MSNSELETTKFSEPVGPGRETVTCLRCGAAIPVPTAGEPDWLGLHRSWHQMLRLAASTIEQLRRQT